MLKINKLSFWEQSFRGVRFSFFNIPPSSFGLFLLLIFAAGALMGCKNDTLKKSPVSKCSDVPQFESAGSEFFSMGRLCGTDIAVVRSVIGGDTLVRKFVMMDSAAAALGTDLQRRGFPKEWLSAVVLRVPLKRVVALSTSQVGFMLRLGLRDKIVGVSDGQYIVDSVLYERARRGGAYSRMSSGGAPGFVESIGYDAGALEKLMSLNLDLVLDFTTGGDYDNYEQISRTNLPLMLTSEWQERSPLAKLEWIKLYGMLFGLRPVADSIFELEKAMYDSLRRLVVNRAVFDYERGGSLSADGGVAGAAPAEGVADDALHPRETAHRSLSLPGVMGSRSEGEASPTLRSSSCPRVLAGMSYGGVWHASGGNSFTANLIRDAGGCYLWASDSSRELTFSFEQVMALADSVDVWVNPSMFSSVDEIVALEPRVKNIKAFKEKMIFQNDGRKGKGGGNDFYEGAVTRPAELLWNLAKCLNGSVPSVNSLDSSYKWYRNIYNF